MVELNDKQIAQIDRVENAAYELCKALLDNEELEWDMSIIGEVADAAANILSDRYLVYYPAIIREDGKERVIDYLPVDDDELAWRKIK